MDESFVSLTALVRGKLAAPPPAVAETVRCAPSDDANFAQADVVHELALMRLAALEAFERSTARLFRALADDVLARELAQSPVDLEALAKRALVAYAEHEPVEIVVSPSDAARVRAPLPIRVDPALVAGDLHVIVREGSFESHFTLRLEQALARIAERSEP